MNTHTPAVIATVLTLSIVILFALIAPTWAAALVACSAIWGVCAVVLDHSRGLRAAREADAQRAHKERETRALREWNKAQVREGD